MSEFLHGAYGRTSEAGSRVSRQTQSAFVYIGTAPVHTIEGGAETVNVPIVVEDIADARSLFGYSDDWASYTLCEAMSVHFEQKNVGPLVFINVLDPTAHKAEAGGSLDKKPEKGRIVILDASSIILDSIVVKKKDGDETKEKGKDYTVSYNIARETITITEFTSGSLGEDELTITYDKIDPSKVTSADVIGSSDGLGLNKGICAIRDVYQLTGGLIPTLILAPGFSSDPEVHEALIENSTKINKHWDAIVYADIPIMHQESPVTLDTARNFKTTNGYNNANEKVFFPLAQGLDEKVYHISVLAAANLQELLLNNGGIPYMSASNTECSLIENLYLGEDYKGRVYSDDIINDKLNKYGITSIAYTGGRWTIWGAQSADYDENNRTTANVADTNRTMLHYVSNNFQHRRADKADKPLSVNDLQSIVKEEQERLDAFIKNGMLTLGAVRFNAGANKRSDIVTGDYVFSFEISTVPLAKSLTADVKWTEDGFVTYFAEGLGSGTSGGGASGEA